MNNHRSPHFTPSPMILPSSHLLKNSHKNNIGLSSLPYPKSRPHRHSPLIYAKSPQIKLKPY